MSKSVVEQIIRPTGLVDPQITIRPVGNQVDDLIGEVSKVTVKGYRTLVTTLTKRMAEELTDYLHELGIRVRYMHSGIDTIQRTEIIRSLRKGDFDVLVGINLLREGLDIPEVALVAILDADKEGFLRSERSLIQTIGRASRNAEGRVILYADNITGSIERAVNETNRRRKLQMEFNEQHGIIPQTIRKALQRELVEVEDSVVSEALALAEDKSEKEMADMIIDLEAEMHLAAKNLEFERAAELRDMIKELRASGLGVYARGCNAVPVTPRVIPAEINVPVACGGVTVLPGDLILTDDDGAVVIPKQLALKVAESAREKEMLESFIREQLLANPAMPAGEIYPVRDKTREAFNRAQGVE